MQYTENYNLYKPVYGEPADVADLNHNADEIDELIHDNRTMIAPAFDTAKAYVTGDPVEYHGKLYVFTADKAAGAWDTSKVEQTTAAEIGGGGTAGDVTKTVSDSTLEITDAAAAPFVGLTSAVEGTQSGSGTPSPENVRPITGCTQTAVTVADASSSPSTFTTYTATFVDTAEIFEATADLVNKRLTITKNIIALGSANWTKYQDSGATYFYTYIPKMLKLSTEDYICTHYAPKSGSSLADLEIGITIGSGGVITDTITIRDDSQAETSASAFKTYLSSGSAKLAYTCSSAVTGTLSLSAYPVKALSGSNYITSTTGDLTAEYITEGYQPLVNPEDFVGATSNRAGEHGLVPAPQSSDREKFLRGDGTWAAVSSGANALAGLTDVDASSPTNGQLIKYNSSTLKWTNTDDTSASQLNAMKTGFDGVSYPTPAAMVQGEDQKLSDKIDSSVYGSGAASENPYGGGDYWYPVNIPANATVTVSTDAIGGFAGGAYINLYAADGTRNIQKSLTNGQSSITFATPNNDKKTVWIFCNPVPTVDITVTIGNSAKPYSVHFISTKECADILKNRVYGERINFHVQNGTVPNASNTNCVRTWDYIPIQGGDAIEFFNDRPFTSVGNHYTYGVFFYDSSKTKLVEGSATPNLSSTKFIAPDNAAYMKATIAEYDSSGNYVQLRDTMFLPGMIYIVRSDRNTLLGRYDRSETQNDMCIDEICPKYFVANTILNGSVANAGNSKLVNTGDYIPVSGGDVVYPIVNKPFIADEDYYYFDSWRFYDSNKATIETGVGNRMSGTDGIKIPSGCAYIRITIGEYASDGTQKTLRYTDFHDGDVVIVYNSPYLEIKKDVVNYVKQTDAYLRNVDKDDLLCAAVRYNKTANNSKDFCLLEITDTHRDPQTEVNATNISDGFNYIDALIHCGDMCASTAGQYYEYAFNAMIEGKKPFFFVVGNHDVGNAYTIASCYTNAQSYTQYIKPLVDAGILTSGEYTDGKSYYYHDFATYKIRLIALYEYDDPNDIDPNDSTKYRIRRGESVISQAQAEWFCATLKSTPANYKVIVAMHQPFSKNADCVQSLKFNSKDWTGDTEGLIPKLFTCDLWADIVDAYVNRSTYTCDMVCTGDAEYLNTNNGKYYTFTYDFSGSVGGFMCFIGGHVHADCVWQHRTYTYQKQITPICGNTNNYANAATSDIRRTIEDSPSKDSLTAIGFDTANNKLRLVKIGVNVTEDMQPRDYEMINCSTDYFNNN